MAELNRDIYDYYNKRVSSAKTERQSFINHWMDLQEFGKPRRGRFLISDRNKGDIKYQSIINNVATQSLKVATAGMLAGTISPSRPWFALETHDPDMMEFPGVKEWLHKVELLLLRIFAESNFYGQASATIQELLLFGTSAMSHVDDFEDVARFYNHTVGSFMIDVNDRQIVDTLIREFQWPASKIVQRFGIENVSREVKTAIDRANYLSWFPVVHFVEPNENFRPDAPWAKNMAYTSVYYEPGNQGVDRGKFLQKRGFNEFPAYGLRWEVTSEDIYGTDCPGMTALGDIKHLQIEERRKAQAIDKMVSPILGGPPSIRNNPVPQLPGNTFIYDSDGGQQKVEPIYTVNPNLRDLRLDIDAVERRIKEAFFVDMFLAITNIEGIQPRNQLDLIQRNEERLLQLGPVLERIQNDFLDPVIDRTFNQCIRADILPPTPEALKGAPLKVRYISTLVQAQRAVATQSLDRLFGFAAGLVQSGWTNVVRKFDANQALDEYAIALGTPPNVLVSDEIVAEQEEQAAQQQQEMLAIEQAQGIANTAKMASDAKTDEANALTELTNG